MAKERREQEEARRQLEVSGPVLPGWRVCRRTLRAPGGGRGRSGWEECPWEAGRLCCAAPASESRACAFSRDPHCLSTGRSGHGAGGGLSPSSDGPVGWRPGGSVLGLTAH